MKKIEMRSNAKVNLALEVLGRRQDGYHELETIMQEIDLCDHIILEDRPRGVLIESQDRSLPLGRENLVYQAWEVLRDYSGLDRGMRVYIDKKIPLGGGLAGGSSNCASVLKGLNKLWDLNYPLETLEELGSQIGSDVPFFIRGGSQLGLGRGTDLRPLGDFSQVDLVLVNPRIEISTREIYGSLDLVDSPSNIGGVLGAMEARDLEGLARLLRNDLEQPVFKRSREIRELKDYILAGDSLGALVSGSGSTVFALCENETRAQALEEDLKGKYPNYRVIRSKTL